MSYIAVLLFILSFPLLADDLLPIEVEGKKNISTFSFNSSQELPLQSRRDSTLAPQLKAVPGTYSVQNGGPGGAVSFFIRGTENRHTSFTLDGLKLNDPSSTGREFDAAFFTSPFLSNVSIHKGPQAVLFGSDSMGGQVEMKTRKGERAPETKLLVNGGSFGTIDSSLTSDWRKHGHQGTLSWSDFHTDGISRLNKKRFNATERDAADITQVASSSRHHWSEDWGTDFLVSYLNGKNELDKFNEDTSKDHSQNEQYIIQQRTLHALSDTEAISLRNGMNRHQRKTTLSKEDYQGNFFQNEVLYEKDLNNIKLLTGAASEQESLNLPDVEKKSNLHSIFLQGFHQFEFFKYQVGLRSEYHSKYGRFDTGSAGVAVYKSNKELSFQYSQGFKAPSLYQLYAPATTFGPQGNPELTPEQNHHMELRGKMDHLELAFFQNRLINLITFNSTKGYQNQGGFIVEGVEVSTPFRKNNLFINPSFVHQSFREEETKILRRPQNSAFIRAQYFLTESMDIFIHGRWVDSRQDIDSMDRYVKLSSYEAVDLGGKYKFSKDEIGLQIVNIFNREYEDIFGYSVMPLSIFVQYGHVF